MNKIHKTREQWLLAGAHALSAMFFPLESGAKVPDKIACSCGFSYRSKDAIGQCFDPKASSDGTTHMFVCPSQDDPVRILDILLHELGHAALGVEEKHGRKFRAFVRAVGLQGKPTATIAEKGTELYDKLARIAEKLGPYPHAALVKVASDKKEKKAGGGWIRMVSQSEDDYKVMISPKQLEECGPPLDPWGEKMVPVNGGGEEGGDGEEDE